MIMRPAVSAFPARTARIYPPKLFLAAGRKYLRRTSAANQSAAKLAGDTPPTHGNHHAGNSAQWSARGKR